MEEQHMRNLYVFDMDGTLADCTHRLHYIHPSGEANYRKDWDRFFKECVNDEPIKWVMHLFNLCRDDVKGDILILTGRKETVRQETNDWLIGRGLIYDYIIMRPEKDHAPDDFLKPKLLADFLRDKDFNLRFIVEDRKSVVDAYRKAGYPVLQCNSGDF